MLSKYFPFGEDGSARTTTLPQTTRHTHLIRRGRAYDRPSYLLQRTWKPSSHTCTSGAYGRKSRTSPREQLRMNPPHEIRDLLPYEPERQQLRMDTVKEEAVTTDELSIRGQRPTKAQPNPVRAHEAVTTDELFTRSMTYGDIT
ncbi:hypothetical protein V8E54_009454 [Elaphomyces granulatus]